MIGKEEHSVLIIALSDGSGVIYFLNFKWTIVSNWQGISTQQILFFKSLYEKTTRILSFIGKWLKVNTGAWCRGGGF